MSKFKLGDKVRYIGPPSSGFTAGKIYVADGYVDEPGFQARLGTMCDDKGCPNGHSQTHFELVESNESELERLVRVANEGYEAVTKIRSNYADKVEIRDAGTHGDYRGLSWERDCPASSRDRHIRIKQKPVFEPFTVGSGWIVKLDGIELSIGCQSYYAPQLRECLDHYARRKERKQSSAYPGFRLTRDGIFDPDAGHGISWEDADRILAALEKAGIK